MIKNINELKPKDLVFVINKISKALHILEVIGFTISGTSETRVNYHTLWSDIPQMSEADSLVWTHRLSFIDKHLVTMNQLTKIGRSQRIVLIWRPGESKPLRRVRNYIIQLKDALISTRKNPQFIKVMGGSEPRNLINNKIIPHLMNSCCYKVGDVLVHKSQLSTSFPRKIRIRLGAADLYDADILEDSFGNDTHGVATFTICKGDLDDRYRREDDDIDIEQPEQVEQVKQVEQVEFDREKPSDDYGNALDITKQFIGGN